MKSEDLRAQVTARLARWNRDGMEGAFVASDSADVAVRLHRDDVGTAQIEVEGASIRSAVHRLGLTAVHAVTPVTTEADFGRLLDGLALLAATDSERETKRQKRERKRAAKEFWSRQ